MVEFEGETIPLIDLADRFGIKPHTLRQRVFKYGMSVAAALAKGIPSPDMVKISGKEITLKAASQKAGLPRAMVKKRLKRGWEIERALTP